MSKLPPVWKLGDALDKLEQLDCTDYKQLNDFFLDYGIHGISFYRDNFPQMNELKSRTKTEDLARLETCFRNRDVPEKIRCWSGGVLSIVAGDDNLKLLEPELKTKYAKDKGIVQSPFYNPVTAGLCFNANINPVKRLQLFSQIIADNVKIYSEKSRDDYIKTRDDKETFQGLGFLLCEASRALLDLTRKRDNLDKVSKYRDALKNAFKPRALFQIEWEYVDDWYNFRYNIATILKNIGEADFVLRTLNDELRFPSGRISFEINVWLAGAIGDCESAQLLMSRLDEEGLSDFEGAILVALGMIGKRYCDEEATWEALDKMVEPLTDRMLVWECRAQKCREKPDPTEIDTETMSLRYLRTLENIQGPDDTAKYIAQRGVSSKGEESELFAKVLGGLTNKQTAFNELKIKFFEGTEDEKETAKLLMTEMGLADAVKLLVSQDAEELYAEYVGKPIKDIESTCKDLLHDTVVQVKHGYKTINNMGIVVFAVGIAIIATGASIAVVGHSDPAQLIAGGASILAGIGTVLVNFARGPVKIVQKALADLVQVETAFVGYIRRTGLASFVFLREYIQKESQPDKAVLSLCASEMGEAAKDTMALVELYCGESDMIKKLSNEDQKLMCKRALALVQRQQSEEQKGEANTSTPPSNPSSSEK